jgi:putative two-component system response regulator
VPKRPHLFSQTLTLATQTRPAHRQFSLSAALAGGLALLLLVLAALTTWQVNTAGEKELRLREAQMLGDTARSMATQLAVVLDERHADLDGLRDLLEHDFSQAEPAQRRALLGRTLAAHRHFTWLGVTDATGHIVLSTSASHEGESAQGQDWYETARRDQTYYGSLHPARPGEPAPGAFQFDARSTRMFDIALPLRAATSGTNSARGAVIGVLGSQLDESLMADVMAQALASRDGPHPLGAAVIDAKGDILYDSLGQLGSVGELPPMQDRGADAPFGSDAPHMGEAMWPGSRDESYFVSAPVPAALTSAATQLQWRVVVRSDAAQLHASVSQLHWRVALVCLSVGLVFAVIGALLLRGTTRSLQELVDDMRRFAITGEPPAPRQAGRITEIDRLHGSLLAMTHHVALQRRALADSQRQMVQALARAGEYRDNDTGQHVLRMSHCAGRLAELAGLDASAVEQIRLAAQLHDLGKIGIPDAVLLKRGRIDEAERAIVRRHPEIGAGILAGFDAPLLALARTVAYTHHERWDGGGYPAGLAGTDIPLSGRIVAVVDVFDALTMDRCYRPAFGDAQALAMLVEGRGSQFDPELVDAYVGRAEQMMALRDRINRIQPSFADLVSGIDTAAGDAA